MSHLHRHVEPNEAQGTFIEIITKPLHGHQNQAEPLRSVAKGTSEQNKAYHQQKSLPHLRGYLRCTLGCKSHDPCFHAFLMEARVMTFVANCTSSLCYLIEIEPG